MAELNKVVENFRAKNVLSDSEQEALLAFKKALNESIDQSPDILKGRPSAEDVMYSDSSNPLDDSFQNILNQYVFNDSNSSPLHGRDALRASYDKLPQKLQDLTSEYQRLFPKVASYSDELKNQQVETLKIAEEMLGTRKIENESGSDPFFNGDQRLDISVDTHRALRNYLEDIQDDESLNTQFEPRIHSVDARGNALDALNELVSLREKQAGVKPRETNDIVTHLMSGNKALLAGSSEEDAAQIIALEEAVIMRNLMNLIATGQSPSSDRTTGFLADAEINWNKPWTLDDSGDTFFSKQVYHSFDRNNAVSTYTLFRERDYLESDITGKNYENLIKAVERVPDLDISPDGPNLALSEIEVGKIAVELMKIRAENLWCIRHDGEEFDVKQVHAMVINEPEVTPDPRDQYLIEVSAGMPPRVIEIANNYHGGLDPWALRRDYPKLVNMWRAEKYQETFGPMPKNAFDNKADLIAHKIPNGEEYDGKAFTMPDLNDHDGRYGYIQTNFGTPGLFFNTAPSYVLGRDGTLKMQYLGMREAGLEDAQTVLEDGKCGAGNTALEEYSKRLLKNFENSGQNAEQTNSERICENRDDCNVFKMVEEEGLEAFRLSPEDVKALGNLGTP